MFNHVKQSLEDLGKAMHLVNADLARGPSLVEGDIPNLKKVMGAVKKIKDEGTQLQFELDQLHETLEFMKLHAMGKIEPLERKHGDVLEAFEKAMSTSPVVQIGRAHV